KAVEARGRRYHRRTELAPELRHAAAPLQHEARHPEQRLAEEAATDAAVDLVVARGRRGLASDFPEQAAGERVAGRFPVAQARRAREAVVHRSLIRVAELVDVVRVGVGDPAALEVALDRRQAGVVIVALEGAPVELVQQQVEADDLERRDAVALARLELPLRAELRQPQPARLLVGERAGGEAQNARAECEPANHAACNTPSLSS